LSPPKALTGHNSGIQRHKAANLSVELRL